MTDFKALLNRAIKNQGVDNPTPDDVLDTIAIQCRDLHRSIADIIDKSPCGDEDATVVLITMLGRAITALSNNAEEAADLYIRIILAIKDVMIADLTDKMNRAKGKPK